MQALQFNNELQLMNNASIPRRNGEALVRVLTAGICNTDLEITKGYAGFTGTLGHEFVGKVVESPDHRWIDKRVVGDINIGCGDCQECLQLDARHCRNRTVLGIKERDGAFAEYLSLPLRNLHEIPDSITNDEAIFAEPLAAVFNILEQVEVGNHSRVAVIGDGKLAQLIVRVLAQTGCQLSAIGKHPDKLQLLRDSTVQTILLTDRASLSPQLGWGFDIVIEASGSASGLPVALQIIKPRGTLILKSTHHLPTTLDLSSVVVNEIKIIGSRCGKMNQAISALESGQLQVTPLITNRYSLDQGLEAFQEASQPESMKILIQIAEV